MAATPAVGAMGTSNRGSAIFAAAPAFRAERWAPAANSVQIAAAALADGYEAFDGFAAALV